MKADKVQITRLLKTARGQIDGILAMVDEDRYCIDISNQLLAAGSVLKKANREVLKAHINSCICDAFEKDNSQNKIDEVLSLIDKLSQ